MADRFTMTPSGIATLAALGIPITEADLRIAGWEASEETPCAAREDGIHCDHWYDGGPCCGCKAPGMPVGQMVEQGMLNDSDYTV